MEYVADNAALEKLKKQYGDPVALISGDYESKNGTEFTFTGGAAMLSPSVTATWNKSSGKLVIKKDGTIEHSGVKEILFLYIAHQDIRQCTRGFLTGERRNLCC